MFSQLVWVKKLKLSFLVFLLFAFTQICNAKYVQTCKVKYRNQGSSSEVYEIEVTFMKGSELNDATSSYSYTSYASYAIIFWSEDQVSTIKLDSDKCGGIYNSSECDYNDFHGLMDTGYIKGTDSDGRNWKICYDNDCIY